MPRPYLTAAFLAAAALAIPFSAPPALATGDDSVDLQIPGNATIKGTIRGVSERESFLLVLPKGATVRAVATRRGKGALKPDLDLVTGDPSSPVFVPGVTVTHQSKGSTLRSPQLPDSGNYRVRVFGDGQTDGDYLLKITVSFRPTFTVYGAAAPGEAELVADFGAPRGAKAQVRLAPRTKTSEFVPALEQLTGPEAFVRAASGKQTSYLRLGATGTYSVAFHEAGAVGGEWKCSVSLRLPALRRSSINISSSRLSGDFHDNQQVYGASVGGAGGTVDPPDIGGPLDGASVTIPGGALPLPVVITMAEGSAFTLPGGGHPAGPVVQFGPQGTTFNGLNATVTLPYDEADFFGSDPVNDLTVYVRNDKTGNVEAIPRETYDFVSVPGSVQFPAPHFSTFVASDSGPRPVAGEWVVVGIDVKPEADYGGTAGVTVAEYFFPPAEGSQTSYTGSRDGRASTWIRAFDDGLGGGAVPVINPAPPFESEFGVYTAQDDVKVIVSPTAPVGPAQTLFRGKSSDVMFQFPDGTASASAALWLRAAEGLATPNNITGRWHAFFWSIGGRAESGAPPVLELHASAGHAVMTFTRDEKVLITERSGRDALTNFPQGGWSSDPAEIPAEAQWQLGDGRLFFRVPDPDKPGEFETSVRLIPCLDGDILVGAVSDPSDESLVLVLVRESGGQKPSAFAGTSSVIGFAASVVDRSLKDQASGFAMSTYVADAVQIAPSKLQFTASTQSDFGHDGGGNPAMKLAIPPSPSTSTLTVDPDGSFRLNNGFFGALAPGRDLFFAVKTDGTKFELMFGPPGRDLLP